MPPGKPNDDPHTDPSGAGATEYRPALMRRSFVGSAGALGSVYWSRFPLPFASRISAVHPCDFSSSPVYDPKTEKLTEYQMPFKWQLPYDAEIDAAGWVWNASMGTDRVVRTNPKTGENIVYMLPYYSNIRRVHVEKGTNTLWIGNNHGASIYKIEPLE